MSVYINNELQSRPQHWPLTNQPTNQPTKQQHYLDQNKNELINV
jgi:hypothetical protein